MSGLGRVLSGDALLVRVTSSPSRSDGTWRGNSPSMQCDLKETPMGQWGQTRLQSLVERRRRRGRQAIESDPIEH